MGRFDGILLAVDFDDTFRSTGEKTVSAENLRAAEEFMAEGGRFTLDTGRDLRSFLSIRTLFTVNAPVVLSNGALLYDPAAEETLWEHFLPFSCRADFAGLLAAFPEVGMEVHRGADVRACRVTPGVEEHLRRMGAPVLAAEPDKVLYPWTKVALIVPGPLRAENPACLPVLRWLEEHCPGRYDAVQSGAIVDVAARGVTKGAGLVRLAEHLGLGPEAVFCAGDSWNDLSMFPAARLSFAPAGALPAVKAAAGRVVGPAGGCIREIVECIGGLLAAGTEETCC